MLVDKVVAEGRNAISVHFRGAEPLKHTAGQYVLLDVLLSNGRLETRAYSLFTLHGVDIAPAILVKRHDGGTVSKHLHDALIPGMELSVSAPMGDFSVVPSANEHVFFAAGSGIAPIVSMLKEALHRSQAHVTLVYVMRTDQDFLLEAQIRELARSYPVRFSLHTWFTSVQHRPSPGELAALGRPRVAMPTIYCCGPAGFIESVETASRLLQAAPGEFHVERFDDSGASGAGGGIGAQMPAVDSLATVDVFGRLHSVVWPAGEKLLDVLLDNKVRVPFSCREGICSACQCAVVKGQTTMLKDTGLSPAEKEAGLSLSCQLLANSASTTVTFT